MNLQQQLDNVLELYQNVVLVTTDYAPVGGQRITVAKDNPNRLLLIFDGQLNGSVGNWFPVGSRSSSFLTFGIGDFEPFYLPFDLNKYYQFVTSQWDFVAVNAPTRFVTVEAILGGV